MYSTRYGRATGTHPCQCSRMSSGGSCSGCSGCIVRLSVQALGIPNSDVTIVLTRWRAAVHAITSLAQWSAKAAIGLENSHLDCVEGFADSGLCTPQRRFCDQTPLATRRQRYQVIRVPGRPWSPAEPRVPLRVDMLPPDCSRSNPNREQLPKASAPTKRVVYGGVITEL